MPNYPSPDELYNQATDDDESYLLHQSPIKTVADALRTNVIDPLNPYAHPIKFLSESSIILRRSAMKSDVVYGTSLKEGWTPFGRGATPLFAPLIGGSRGVRGQVIQPGGMSTLKSMIEPLEGHPLTPLNATIKQKVEMAGGRKEFARRIRKGTVRTMGSGSDMPGLFMGAMFGATAAYNRGEDLSGIAQGAVGGAFMGTLLFGRGGGVSGLLRQFAKTEKLAGKLEKWAHGTGGYLFTGFGNESLVRTSVTGGPKGKRIAMGAEYTGTANKALNEQLEKYVTHVDDLVRHRAPATIPEATDLTRAKAYFEETQRDYKHYRSGTAFERNESRIAMGNARKLYSTARSDYLRASRSPMVLEEQIRAHVTDTFSHVKLDPEMIKDLYGIDVKGLSKASAAAERSALFSRANTTIKRRGRKALRKQALSINPEEIASAVEGTQGLNAPLIEALTKKELGSILAQRAIAGGVFGGLLGGANKGMIYRSIAARLKGGWRASGTETLIGDIMRAQTLDKAAMGSTITGIAKGELKVPVRGGAIGEAAFGKTATKNLITKGIGGMFNARKIEGMIATGTLTNLIWAGTVITLGAQAIKATVTTGIRAASEIASSLNSITRVQFGTGRAFESEQANTERTRAIAAISNAGLNARMYLGREAELLSQ
jgi:hypothetical protein